MYQLWALEVHIALKSPHIEFIPKPAKGTGCFAGSRPFFFFFKYHCTRVHQPARGFNHLVGFLPMAAASIPNFCHC